MGTHDPCPVALAAHETGGTIGIVENLVRPGWPGPPLHHHAFDETFVMSLRGAETVELPTRTSWVRPYG